MSKRNESTVNWKKILGEDKDFLKPMVAKMVQEILEQEMVDTVGARKGERSDSRTGYRSGYYDRKLITRVGRIELMVPQDRDGNFSTEIFDSYQRSEKALLAAIAEMYVHGVSTRKINVIVEELCGHGLSAGAVSHIVKKMDEELKNWAERKLESEYPYLILDARYEKIREHGVVRSYAVLIALGVSRDGRREVLAVEVTNKETEAGWQEFLERLKERGLRGVEYVASDSHAGLKSSIAKVLPEAIWQRCYVHFLRNAAAKIPAKMGNECMDELKAVYNCSDLQTARRGLREWVLKWNNKCQNFCDWVEENIEETLTFYALPPEHRKKMRSTNMLERLNEELKRRTRVVRIFPNIQSCLRLIRALAVETHEQWMSRQYLDMSLLNNWNVNCEIVLTEKMAS